MPGILVNVSGWVYSCCMAKHEVVNEILEYLDIRKRELEQDMLHAEADGNSDYAYYEGSYETYDHLIAKLEDDYR